jgi:hypothetical protein
MARQRRRVIAEGEALLGRVPHAGRGRADAAISGGRNTKIQEVDEIVESDSNGAA